MTNTNQTFHKWPLFWLFCITYGNTVLLQYGIMVTEYSTTGQVLQAADSLFGLVNHIRVCPGTGNIVVCGLNTSTSSVNHNVSVFNPGLKLRYQFIGTSQSHQFDALASPFDPQDADFDLQGRLFVVDFSNKCVYVVGCEGQLLTIIPLH